MVVGGCSTETNQMRDVKSETLDTDSKTVVEIFSTADWNGNEIMVPKEKMEEVRKLFRNNSVKDIWMFSENSGIETFVWNLSDELQLVIDNMKEGRQLILARKSDYKNIVVRTANMNESGDVSTLNQIAIGNDYTIEIDDNVGKLWQHGKMVREYKLPERFSEENLILYDWTDEHTYLSGGTMLLKLYPEGGEAKLIAEDFSGKDISQVYNSLFYINTDSKLTFVNLKTFESEVISDDDCESILTLNLTFRTTDGKEGQIDSKYVIIE